MTYHNLSSTNSSQSSMVLKPRFQHFPKVLSQRAVAYLNIDLLIEGMDTLRYKSTPMLYDVAYRAAKKVTENLTNFYLVLSRTEFCV